MNSKSFADILVCHGVVDGGAVDDPTGYDNGATLDRIRAAFAVLELETITPLLADRQKYAGEVQRLAEVLFGGKTVAPFREVLEKAGEVVCENAALREKIECVYRAGSWGIDYVGAANYRERQVEAEQRLTKAYES